MNFLLVPIKLDALVLASKQAVVGPLVDFSRMPFMHEGRDVNGDVPFLSSELLAEPLSDKDLVLGRGIHLHWALPAALTRAGGRQTTEQTQESDEGTQDSEGYPAVPDRWLIIRRSADFGEGEAVPTRLWVVESNYWSESSTGGALYPLKVDAEHGVKSVYLGRSYKLLEGVPPSDGAEGYLSEVTAIGHGDPTFAAFYPNCRNIFGFHDKDVSVDDLSSVTYEIAGWYSRPEQDLFANTIRSAMASGLESEELLESLKRSLGVDWDGIGFDGEGDRVIFNANIRFEGDPKLETHRSGETKVVVANTTGEALSSFLAPGAEGDLEALRLYSGLEPHKSDLVQKFEETRHQEGFLAIPGAAVWGIQERAGINLPAEAGAGNPTNLSELPKELAGRIHSLNRAQIELDDVVEKIGSLRSLIYSDWCKYMAVAYPAPGTAHRYPWVDDAKEFLEEILLVRFDETLAVREQNKENVDGQVEALKGSIRNWERDGRLVNIAPLQDGNGVWQIVNALSSWIPLEATGTGLSIEHGEELVTDYLRFSDGGSLEVPVSELENDLTFMTWVCTDRSPSDNAIAGLHFGSASIVLWKSTAGELTLRYSAANERPQVLLAAEKSIVDGQWHHLAFQLSNDGGSQRVSFFVDGVVAGSVILEQPSLVSATQAVLKMGAQGGSSLQGKLTKVRLYKKLLSIQAIQRNMLDTQYKVRLRPGPRYWQPREPAVLLVGDAVRLSDRHGQRTSTVIRSVPVQSQEDNVQTGTLGHGSELVNSLLGTVFAGPLQSLGPIQEQQGDWESNVCDSRPWHPFMLEWEAEMFPTESGGSLDLGDQRYAPSFILDSYQFDGGVDLVSRANTTKGPECAFRGRSLLTPHAEIQLRKSLEVYFRKQDETKKVVSEYNAAVAVQDQLTQPLAELREMQWRVLAGWYTTNKPILVGSDFDKYMRLYVAIEETPTLAQVLSGFNDALLMHRQCYQLPIADPLGFEAYQQFTARVAAALEGVQYQLPEPESTFMPIRTGEFKLHALRMVDTFGQTHDLSEDDLDVTYPSTWAESNSGRTHLSPRFIQPAMLDLRWISAGHQGEETNDHQGTGPICGWLMANELDLTIAVYAADGSALGAIGEVDSSIRWMPAPGQTELGFLERPTAQEIPQDELRKVVLRIMEEHSTSKGGTFQTLLADLNVIASKIDPENFEQHQSLALLVGRPFAVVRASVKFWIHGEVALDQSWPEFERAINETWSGTGVPSETFRRESGGVYDVQVPLILGDHDQLNDGVVGYWMETTLESGINELGDFTPRLPEDPAAAGKLFSVSANDSAKTVTILMDPRGKVHATTGVLPVKSIDIPTAHFSDALNKIEIYFLTSPILTGEELVSIPLPKEEGYAWSWYAKEEGTWEELGTEGVLRKQNLVSPVPEISAEQLWEALVSDGWITPDPEDVETAAVVAIDQRKESAIPLVTLDLDDQALALVESLLAATHIVPPSTQSAFQQRNMIREGWLKLRPQKNLDPS